MVATAGDSRARCRRHIRFSSCLLHQARDLYILNDQFVCQLRQVCMQEANKRAMELPRADAASQPESLEDALTKLRRRIDLDDYDNKPVPR